MIKSLVALLSCAILSGCAGGYIDKSFTKVHPPSFDAVRNWPAVGAETTVQVGETMISAYLSPVMPAVVLAAPFRHVIQYRSDLRMAVDLPQGTMELAGTDDVGGRFFGAQGGVRIAYESKGKFDANVETLPGGVHIAANGAKSVYWVWSGATAASTAPAPELAVLSATVEHPPRKARFQKQLVYSGISQTTASVLYRELSNDIARPAFSQELKYELAKGQTIGYQRARFEILEAGNTSIRYRVLSPLEIEDKQR